MFVKPHQRGWRGPLDQLYGEVCALFPTALHGSPAGRLDQVIYLCGNELDSPSEQPGEAAVLEWSQDQTAPERQDSVRGGLCVRP